MLMYMYDKQPVLFFNGHDCGTVIICKHTTLLSGQINDFLANDVRYLLSPIRLSCVVCNVRAPYSGGSDFRQYFYGIRYLGELRTLRIQDTSDPGHFGTSLVGPNCPDRSALVPKCPKDSSDLSAELSSLKCRTVPSQVPKCLGPCLTTTV